MQRTAKKSKLRCMTMLSLARMEVEVEVAHEGVCIGVVHLVLLYVLMPHMRVRLRLEGQTEQALINVKHF